MNIEDLKSALEKHPIIWVSTLVGVALGLVGILGEIAVLRTWFNAFLLYGVHVTPAPKDVWISVS